jgi:hypothetical protein
LNKPEITPPSNSNHFPDGTLFGHAPRRMSRTITPNEAHLNATNMNQAIVRDFPEWRANEFMGSSVVPRGLLLRLLQHQAARMGIPLEETGQVSELVPITSGGLRVTRALGSRERTFKMPRLIRALAGEFGVSRRFIEVRLLRYGRTICVAFAVSCRPRHRR